MTAASDAELRARVSFWNDPKIRSAAVQSIMVLVVGFLFYEIIHNTIDNLTRRNIATGFGFFNKSAGFDLIQSLIFYSSESTYGRALVVVTLKRRLCLARMSFSRIRRSTRFLDAGNPRSRNSLTTLGLP